MQNMIFYNGCYIRDDGDGHYTAFFYDEDGDLNELTTKDLDKAKRVIDEHPFDENGEPYEQDPNMVAKIVEFSIQTRVVVPNTGGEETVNCAVMEAALKNIRNDIEGYVCWDNVVQIADDDEMPYDPEFDDDDVYDKV